MRIGALTAIMAESIGRCILAGEHLRYQRHRASECPVGRVLPRDINNPKHVLTVQPLGCHPGCHEVTGTHHETEINPVGGDSSAQMRWDHRWRSECRTCGTVLDSTHPDQMAALDWAMQHAQENQYIH